MKLRRECELSPPVSWSSRCSFLQQTPPLNRVARQLRISAQIIFFQRKEGVGLGKGARACGKSYVSDTREKKRYIDFGLWVGYYVE